MVKRLIYGPSDASWEKSPMVILFSLVNLKSINCFAYKRFKVSYHRRCKINSMKILDLWDLSFQSLASLSKPETIEKKYVGKMSSKALSLMAGMLNMEVSKRFSAIECLAHPYFDGMRNEETENLIQGYNQLKQ
jgi:serine/threonine protein kinase